MYTECRVKDFESLDEHGSIKRGQVTSQKPTVDVSTASTKGWTYEMNGERMTGMVWYQGHVTGLNRKLKPGWAGDREREKTGTGLPSACWLSLAGWRKETPKKKNKRATQR